MINIYIGYDKKEISTFHVLVQSLLDTSNTPVCIIPLKIEHLSDIYTREDKKGTTEFSLTRFLVPYLSNYSGVSIFMDCDMLCRVNIMNVLTHVRKTPNKSVYVCKHEYTSKYTDKATGVNENYPRKNWSSFMIFNNYNCKVLTPNYVNTASPADLHRFNWVNDDDIGDLPLEYNWLVGEYEKNDNAKVVHYTIGSPCFAKYKNSDYSEEWFKTHNKFEIV